MSRKLDEFTGVFPVDETLTFELKPVGKTAEHLEASGLLKQDEKRAEDYPLVKEFLDEQHKAFLQRVLSNAVMDWNPLAETLRAYRKDKNSKKDLEGCQAEFRKKISDFFTKDTFYDELSETTPSKLFKRLMKSGEVPEEVKTFAVFACYFKGYQENRRNIYSPEAQATSAAHRAVDENFTKFYNAVEIFDAFRTKFPELIRETEERIAPLLDGEKLADLFQVSAYNRFLPQSGIDRFNAVVGEINYAVNQYRQQHPEIQPRELPFIPPLFKQILSDRERSFSAGRFQNDGELSLALKQFIAESVGGNLLGEGQKDLFAELRSVLRGISRESDLYVSAKELDRVSLKTTGSWNGFRDAMTQYADETLTSKARREKYCRKEIYSFAEISAWDIRACSEEGETSSVDFTDFWHGEYAGTLFDRERELRGAVSAVLDRKTETPLRERQEDVAAIKEYLDTVQEIFHLLKPLNVGSENGGDPNLLGLLTALYGHFEKIIPLYNHVRNYVTQKPEDTAKIKLMFNRPTLADGWDSNKEKDNLAVIFRNGNSFFLGIVNPKTPVDFAAGGEFSGPTWQKMVYKLLPGPNKMLPKVFFSRKNIDFYAPSATLLQRYQEGAHKKGDKFDISFCRELIDFFKSSIARHEDWSKFGFKFSPTSSYTGIDEFYREVTEQGYSLSFKDVPESYIMQLVDEGKLYLFQIWNKDFSEKSTGTPNKFTLYWKALFDRENLADVVFKLNGEAELFQRKPVIRKEITHPAGSKLVNRTIVTEIKADKAVRTAVPERTHSEIYRMVNGFSAESDLSPETRAFLEKYKLLFWEKGMRFEETLYRTVVKSAPFDLIRNRRYTENKYSFHVPIKINFKAMGAVKFNEKVLEYLRGNPEVKIIGIDRGERNLIYLVLMDQQGHILKQKSLNLVGGVDYHGKLDNREKERDQARKSWSAIGRIKDLKEGYLSGAVYEIVRMMVENNAIVVMEDLNFGFKRGRIKIEKQVYQKFEKALIDKLNYLVFKDTASLQAPGGVLAGYQLSGKFESFQKLGRQCGFIFYVPAGFTSKIDPATGFANLFRMPDFTGRAAKEFFEKFDAISYNAARDAFAFSFDYRNFKTAAQDFRNKWTVYSLKEAWQNEKDARSGKFMAVSHDPTAEIKEALKNAGVDPIPDGFDLLAFLKKTPAENARFFKAVFYAFKLSVALRHSSKDEDKIVSPVPDAKGEFFDSSRYTGKDMPLDADANGAYHIALKGLYLLRHDISEGKPGKLPTEEWLKFAQQRNG